MNKITNTREYSAMRMSEILALIMMSKTSKIWIIRKKKKVQEKRVGNLRI